MIRTGLLAGLVAFGASGAMAASVDFENEAPLTPDPTLIAIGDTYVNGGITFTSTEVMQLVGVGPNPRSGFVPNDDPGQTVGGAPTNFGEVFLTGDFNRNTDMTLSFAEATFMSFDIVDIDGGNDNVVGDAAEENFAFNFLNGGVSQGITIVNSRDLTGPFNDAGVINVSFTGFFDSVEIVGTTPGGNRNIGWGIDNIVTVESNPGPNVVPLPAGGVLILTALGGFGLLRARRRRS